MATRARKADPTAAVALVPVNAGGEIIHGAGSWPMPADGEPPGPPGSAYDDEERDETPADRIMATLSNNPGDERALVKVERMLASGKRAWCKDYSPAEWEEGGLEMIRHAWGPGVYMVTLFGSLPGTKRYVMRTRQEIEIQNNLGVAPGAVAAPAAPISSPRLDAIEAALLKLAERPPVDSFAEMQKMFTMVGAMKQAFGLDQKPEKSSVTEMLEMMREMRAASEELNPPKEGGDSLLGMASKLIPLIGTMAGQPKQPGALSALPTAAETPIDNGSPIAISDQTLAPPVVAGDAPPPTGDAPMSAELLAVMKMKAYIAVLMTMAKTNVDAQKGAELIFDRLPDEFIDLMALEQWWDLFVAQVPEAVPYREWFTKARDLALKMFDEGESEQAPPEGGVTPPKPAGG